MYRLFRFGDQDFEHYNQVDSIGSGTTPTAYQPLPDGGAFDLYGNQQRHPGVVERVKSLRLRGTSEADLESVYLGLLAQRGKRDRLYRRMSNGDIHWIYARLREVSARRSYEIARYKVLQDVDLIFETQEAIWHGSYGSTWYLDDGEYLDSGLYLDSGPGPFDLASSPTLCTLSIGEDTGRAPTRALLMRITAGSAAITSITVARTGGESLTFGDTIAAGDIVEIDTGTMQVTNDGADAYDGLSFSPTADMAAWFTLLPGDNEITVTFSGGGTGSTIEYIFYEVWY